MSSGGYRGRPVALKRLITYSLTGILQFKEFKQELKGLCYFISVLFVLSTLVARLHHLKECLVATSISSFLRCTNLGKGKVQHIYFCYFCTYFHTCNEFSSCLSIYFQSNSIFFLVVFFWSGKVVLEQGYAREQSRKVKI